MVTEKQCIKIRGFVMHINWQDHIVSTSDVLRGKPRIKGTRIPVSFILGYLSVKYSYDNFT